VRCGIYTRKSTEEGLDQEFNSLDAQYEACAAFITSQRHEGWSLMRDRYDDGGFSGGNMDRPALKRLLADVQAGKVDTIVVYKVDRLTRALSDFAKIVEVLDARGASFVSITQAFNTTTSMGRLTLNVLLSFAQFEREVISERVRDKIAASRKKGMWMGGTVPLGYDVQNRKLVVNQAEAETVRHIMRRYTALGCGRLLLEELLRDGICTKPRSNRDGAPFQRGPLFYLLSNRVYLGEVQHRGSYYPGEHRAIVDQPLWDAVQETLARMRSSERRRATCKSPSLLVGLVYDQQGRRMQPSHANKAGRRYRYYVTAADAVTTDEPAARLPAHDLEEVVKSRLVSFLTDRTELRRVLMVEEAAELELLTRRCSDLAATLNSALLAMIDRIDLIEGAILLFIDRNALAATIGRPLQEGGAPITLAAPAVRLRHGKEVRMVLTEGAGDDSVRNPHLVALLTEAAEAKQLVNSSSGLSITQIAKQAGRCRCYLAKLYRVAHLAPDIAELIMSGRQPAHLTTPMLLTNKLPLSWTGQRVYLGMA
jgi:DNA invertase Pin-like site-specific DNA recombinase